MIDLRKPLEGVAGLLLMAALVFFGATLGITVALVCSWVEMKDSLANFLGGVVGAGLGAALAVIGAVYVQQQARRDSLIGPATALTLALQDVQRDTFSLGVGLRPPESYLLSDVHHERLVRVATGLHSRFRAFAFVFELGQNTNEQLDRLKLTSQVAMEAILQDLRNPSLPANEKYVRCYGAARETLTGIGNLIVRLGNEFGSPVVTLVDELDVQRWRGAVDHPTEPLSHVYEAPSAIAEKD